MSYGSFVACGRRSLPLGPVLDQAAGFITAPSMTTPWVTYFHNATRSLRASATIARLRCAACSLALYQKQRAATPAAAALRVRRGGETPPAPGGKCPKPRPPVAPQRGVVGYALCEQKTLDPVHMRDALLDQCPPLAAKPPAILFLGRGRNHHRADPRLAALVGEKRPQQRLAVKPGSLGPPAPPRRRDRGRIDHMALNAVLLQNTVQPEPFQPRLRD